MNCNNNQNNNNGCGCNCNPHPTPAHEPVDINMTVCDRNINMLPMLQTYTTKVLKPNINGCCKKNILTQQMMNCENYKYVIKWDFDLNGQTITVPENCILEFDGGSLKNGTIIGQDTVYINVGDVDIWGEDLTRQGTWKEHSGGGGGGHEEDRPYDPANFVGMGKKYIPKNVVLIGGVEKNVLTQGMINQSNTIYVIQYDFDLNGEEIEIPNDCALLFDGGTINNGSLVFDDTIIISEYTAFKNVEVSGTVKNDVQVKWFDIDDTGETECSEVLSMIFNLGTNKIVFPAGRFSFKHIEINHSIEVCGQPGTVFNALDRNAGINGFDHLFITDCDNVYFHDFEVTGDTTELEVVATNRNYPLFYIENAVNVYFRNVFFNDVECVHVSTPGENQFLLILFKQCVNATIDSCEFAGHGTGNEWIGTVDIEEDTSDIDFFKFTNNYIHDSNKGNSITSVNAKKFWCCGNKVKNFLYTGSVFNLHGEDIIIKDNVIEDCWATSVFDTCEYGGMINKSVLVKDNVVNCKNAIVILTTTDRLIVSGNIISALQFIYIASYTKNDPRNSYWSGKEYEPFNECSYIEITDNYADCNGYEIREDHPLPAHSAFRSGIANYCNWVKCKQFIVKDNTILCEYDEAFSSIAYARTPILIGVSENVCIENNYIDGAVPVPGSGTYCYSIYLFGTDSYYSQSPDRIYKQVSIKNNAAKGLNGRVVALLADGGAVKNSGTIDTRIKILDFYKNDFETIVTGGQLSVDVLNADSIRMSGAFLTVNADFVYNTVGIGKLNKGKIIRIADKHSEYDCTVYAIFNTCIVKYDSVEDAGTALDIGAVVSFGGKYWMFVQGDSLSNTVQDIIELHDTTGYSEGDVRRLLRTVGNEQTLSYWKLCSHNADRVIEFLDEFTHGGGTVSRPKFGVGLKADRNGFCYFDTTLKRPVFYDGVNNKWLNDVGLTPNPSKGTFDQAMAVLSNVTSDDAGLTFFDTDNKRILCYGGDEIWYNAFGEALYSSFGSQESFVVSDSGYTYQGKKLYRTTSFVPVFGNLYKVSATGAAYIFVNQRTSGGQNVKEYFINSDVLYIDLKKADESVTNVTIDIAYIEEPESDPTITVETATFNS